MSVDTGTLSLEESVANARQGEMGERAVSAGSEKTGDRATRLVDTLTNLMHFAHAREIDFAKALKTPTMHFEAELRGEA